MKKRQGTIPKKATKGQFLGVASAASDKSLLVENLHIDGYKTAISLPVKGKVVVRNNYIHHQYSNGLVYGNFKGANIRLQLEVCGNEIAHAGKGNAEHGLYLHRALHPTSSADVTFLDNVCHSTPYSSCYKSIANKNTLVNNRFHHSLDTDLSFKKQYSSMLVDIAACAENLIERNQFHGHKAFPNSHGEEMVAIRNRKKPLKGCDRPPYGSDDFNNPDYWASLKGAKIFPTTIRDNLFRARPENASGEDYGDRLHAITMMGTFPNEPLRTFGPARLLEPGPYWYERSRVYASGNRYVGFSDLDHIYRSMPPRHCRAEGCGKPPSRQPDSDLIEVGLEEKIEKIPQ
jgi:hypothetical protein